MVRTLDGTRTSGSASGIGIAVQGEGSIITGGRGLWATIPVYIRLGKPRVVGLLLLVAAISYVVAAQGTVAVCQWRLKMSHNGRRKCLT